MGVTIIFAVIIAGGVLLGWLSEGLQNKIGEVTARILRVLSILIAMGYILYLFGEFTDTVQKMESAVTIQGFLIAAFLAIPILAITNLIYYATVKYHDEKKNADIAEYKLHLIEKGESLKDINECYSDYKDGKYIGGSKNLRIDVNAWRGKNRA